MEPAAALGAGLSERESITPARSKSPQYLEPSDLATRGSMRRRGSRRTRGERWCWREGARIASALHRCAASSRSQRAASRIRAGAAHGGSSCKRSQVRSADRTGADGQYFRPLATLHYRHDGARAADARQQAAQCAAVLFATAPPRKAAANLLCRFEQDGLGTRGVKISDLEKPLASKTGPWGETTQGPSPIRPTAEVSRMPCARSKRFLGLRCWRL
jgi:hypothetical protein